MGGGGSKPTSNKMTFKFVPTKIPKIDLIFEDASKLLKRAEEVRAGLEESKTKAIELSKCNWVKGDVDKQFQESIRILLWTVSAECGGKIANAGIRVSSEAPYFEMNPVGKSPKVVELYDQIVSFIKAAIGGSATLKEANDGLTKDIEKAKPFLKSIKVEAKSQNLNPKDTTTATTAYKANTKLLTLETPKVKVIMPVAAKATTTMKAIGPQLQEMVNKADDIGKNAAAANVKLPTEIFDKYYTGDKKTADEVAGKGKGGKGGKDGKGGKGGKTPPGKPDPKSAPSGTTPSQSNNQTANNQPTNNQNSTTNPTANNNPGGNQQGQNPGNTGQNQINPNLPNNQGQPTNQQSNPNQSSVNPNNPNMNIINNNNSSNPQNNNNQNVSNFGGNLQNNSTNTNKGGINYNNGDNSPFSNNSNYLSSFNTPVKGRGQEEDVFDEEDNRAQPIIKSVQESNLLHQSSIKRQRYIKTNI
jgi:hypothetical protein